jgi:hypothetical protein
MGKVIDAPLKISDIFYLTVNFKFTNFSFQIFLPFVSEVSTSIVSYIFYITLFRSCNHCILACFFDLKIVKIILQTMVYAA